MMKRFLSLIISVIMVFSLTFVSGISIVSATTVSPTPINVALNKPVTKPDDHTYYTGKDGTKMVDGDVTVNNFVYLNTDSTNTLNFLKIDLLNYYNVSRIELVERGSNWISGFLDNVDIVGSNENIPVAEMPVIKNTGTARGTSAGSTWSFDLPVATKYRYIALRATRGYNSGTVLCLSEARVFATEVSENIGAWVVKDSTNIVQTKISPAGGTYAVSIPVTNYNTARTDYILVLGGYDANGVMTNIACTKVVPSAIGVLGTLSGSIVLPAGTVKLAAVLIENLDNALMVVDSLNLTQ